MVIDEKIIADADERHRIKLAKYDPDIVDTKQSDILWEEALREAFASRYCQR